MPQGTTAPFTVINGTASWNGSGTLGTVNATDRAIVSWNQGAFNIATGETYSFLVPSGGAILNKVGYGANGVTTGVTDTAVINGTLTSTGRVVVLANGSISVGPGSVINTASGLILSTLLETDNFTFATSGNLALTGAPTGGITLGGAGSQVSVAGSLGAWGNTVAVDNLSVSGDLIVNQRSNLSPLNITGANGLTNVGGNLTVSSNNTAINQGTSALVVGNATTINTNGPATVTLTNAANSFNTVSANVGNLSLADSSSIIIGNSTISGNLAVTAANDISTGGVVAVTGNVNLTSTVAGNVTYANNSTVGGTFNATVAAGNVNVATVGALNIGAITGPSGSTNSLSAIAITNGGTGYTSVPTVTITGGGGTGATATATINTTTGQVTSVVITNPGTGYTGAPTVALSGGTGSPASIASATATVVAPVSTTVSGLAGGTGYTAAPTVVVSGGGGTGATATATIDTNTNVVTGITIVNAGTGYTAAPTLTISGGGGTGADATLALAPGGLGPVAIANGGTGYVTAPTVTITGGGGTGSAATAAITGGAVSGITVGTPGTGYTAAPTITFGGGGGITATLAPVLNLLGGAVVNISTTGTATISGAVNASSVTISGTSISAIGAGNVQAGGPAVFNASAGGVILPTVNASRLEVRATNGSISQLGGTTLATTASGATSIFNAGTTGAISLTNAGNALNNATLQLTGTTATVNNTRSLSIGATNLSGGLNVSTVGSAPGQGAVTFGADFGTAAQDIAVGGAVSIATNYSDIREGPASSSNVFGSMTLSTIPTGVFGGVNLVIANGGTGYTAAPTVTITGGGGTGATATAIIDTLTGSVTGFTVNPGSGYTATPTVTFGAVAGASGLSVSASTGGDIAFEAAQLNQGGNSRYGQFIVPAARDVLLTENTAINVGSITARAVTLNSVSGDILLNGTINSNTVSANANTGSITQGASGVVQARGNTDWRASNSFGTNLSSSANQFGGTVRFINGRDNIVVASSNIALANNTSVVAANSSVTVTTVGGGLDNTIIANGNITRLNANSGGAIVIQGGNFNTMNLTANDASATSITSNVTGVNATNTLTVNGTLSLKSNGNVTLNHVSNNITGNVVLNETVGDVTVYSARDLRVSGNGGGNLTVVAGAGASASTFSNPWNVILGNLNVRSLTAAASNANSAIGGLATSNTTIVTGGTGYTSAPTVTFIGGGSGATATATIDTAGAVTGITITNPGIGYFTTPTVVLTGGGGTGASATVVNVGGNASAGNSGTITQQTGTRVHAENSINLITINGDVVLGNNGNNFGRVEASTGAARGVAGSGNITIVEDQTMKVGLIATTGNATLTSRFGSVIEDPVDNVIVTANGTASVLTLAAPSGSVQLGGVNRVSGTTTGDVTSANITASGSAQLRTAGNLTLGAMSANSLNVTANNIAQSGPLNIFGLSSFTATNNITLTNSANNFGPLSLTTLSANGSIAVTESSTLNLRSVSMLGGGTQNATFTATSLNGDIIDTGLGGVRLGGAVVNNVPVVGQGVVTLAATNGNIVLDDPTSDVLSSAGIVFNAQNVTISVLGSLGSNLVLGAAGMPSSVSGNLTASSALGNIGNAGPLSVGGTAFFQTGNGNITIAQSGVGFGALRFVGNQVSIQEAGNMDILTGSTAFGPANLVSGGNISIVDAGGGQTITFGNTVNLSATGNITLRLVQAVGQLAATATGTKDLSALSISTDLNNRTPIFGGTGANIDPRP